MSREFVLWLLLTSHDKFYFNRASYSVSAAMSFPLPGRTTDFHRLDCAHVGRRKKVRACGKPAPPISLLLSIKSVLVAAGLDATRKKAFDKKRRVCYKLN